MSLLTMSLLKVDQKSRTPLPFRYYRVEPKTELRGPFRYSGLTKSKAEELMDWLEAQGRRDFDLSVDDEGFNIEPL
jgi:hypothetical protein